MAIEERFPTMSDKELGVLQDNAVRLAEGGNAKQKQEADRLLPLITTELAERKARAPARAPAKTAVRKKAKAKA